MPTPYIKKLAKQTGKPVAEVERLWDKANEQASKAGRTDDYAYITGILKHMVGASVRLEASSRLLASDPVLRLTPVMAALVEAGFIDKIKSLPNLGHKAKSALVHEFKEQVHHVADNLHTTKGAVVTAFKEPKMSNMLEAAGYSFGTIWGAMHLGHKLAEQGALHVFAHFAEHTALHKVAHHGAHKVKVVDEFMSKYPVLKKVTGPALAGLMLYGYTLTEPHKLGDWDMSNIKKAFTGEFGVADFMQTPEALYLGTHVATGKALSLSALVENTTTLTLGLACTAITQSKNPKLQALAGKIQSVSAKFKPKKSVLADIESSKTFTGHAVVKQVAADKAAGSSKPAGNKPVVDKPREDKGENSPDWWKAMSDEAQTHYLEQHPNSDYQKTTASYGKPSLKLEAKTRLAAKLDGRDTKKVQLTLEGTPEALNKLLNLLGAIQYNTGVGHSCMIGAFFDGDGADKIYVKDLPDPNKEIGKDMAAACSDRGDGLLAQIDVSKAFAYYTTWSEVDGKQVELLQKSTAYPDAD